MTLDKLDLFGDAYNSSGFNKVFYSNNEAAEPKTIDFPDTYTFDDDIGFKAIFVNGDVSVDADTHMTLNGKSIKINHEGTLIDLPVHTLTEGSSTVYRSLQPKTILDLFYDSESDSFVVIGNPTVICNQDNIILADGTVIWDFIKDRLDENYGLTPEHYDGTARYAESIKTTGNSANSYHKVPFLNRTGESSGSENTDILEDTEDTFAYNPNTNDLKVQSVTGNLNGVATSAVAMRYVTVNTLSGNENKTVSVPGFELSRHARLILKFINGNTRAALLTLNVNDTGDKNIYLNGVITSPVNFAIDIGAEFIAEYDGDNWRLDSIYETYSARNAGYADTAGNANNFAGLSYADAKANILSGNAASATEAAHAASADSATNASYATNAGHASTADSATNATNASYATNATNATSADSAGSAGSAGYANKLNIANAGQATFNWSGQDGQPSWLFGSNNGVDVFVYNPSNFSVNYATSAGSAGSCTGNAASATTAASCTGNAASATTAESCSGNAATASDASKFDGKTFAEATAKILEGKAATAGVADSAGDSTKLGGHSVVSTTTTTKSNDYWSYVRESAFDSNGGYIVYSNGLTIQWGYIAASPANPSFNFPVPFSYTPAAVATLHGISANAANVTSLNNASIAIDFAQGIGANKGGSWIAIGYSN